MHIQWYFKYTNEIDRIYHHIEGGMREFHRSIQTYTRLAKLTILQIK